MSEVKQAEYVAPTRGGIMYHAKPIFTTFNFELKKQWKKFIIFAGFAILFSFLLSYLIYALIPSNPLPATQADYFSGSLGFLQLIVIFSTSFFFGGIICSEFSEKTGHIVFPIINKYKLLAGKFLANFLMLSGVIGVFYLSIGLYGLGYYGFPITIRYLYSYGVALLYALATASFVTLFSSFIKSVNMAIVGSLLILLIANMIIDQLITSLLPEFEPIYSLNHAQKLVSYILKEDFPTEIADRYTEIQFRDFISRNWLTPTIETGLLIMLSYTAICLTISLLIYRRKQF